MYSFTDVLSKYLLSVLMMCKCVRIWGLLVITISPFEVQGTIHNQYLKQTLVSHFVRCLLL